MDCGFECDFVAYGDNIEDVIGEFRRHTEEEHGIDYSKDAIMQYLLRESARRRIGKKSKNMISYPVLHNLPKDYAN